MGRRSAPARRMLVRRARRGDAPAMARRAPRPARQDTAGRTRVGRAQRPGQRGRRRRHAQTGRRRRPPPGARGRTTRGSAGPVRGSAIATATDRSRYDSPLQMEFRSIYQHGFARVAACTGRVALVDPPANAAMVVRQARACSEEGVGVAVFPELTLTGYSLEDLVLQDAVLDEVETALG